MPVEERKQKEKLKRYNAILDAAEKILRENGLSSLNIELVAKETELAKGTLYLYFKSKEEILGALSIKSRLLLLKQFQKATKSINNPIEKLKAICITCLDFYKKYPFYFELIAIYEVNNKLEETIEIQSSINAIIDFVNEITIDAKMQGLLNRNLDPVQYTFCLWGMITGMAQLVKVRGAIMKKHFGFTEKDIINTYLQQLEMGMKN
jgi:TetR/AcrR family transcriptional regulator